MPDTITQPQTVPNPRPELQKPIEISETAVEIEKEMQKPVEMPTEIQSDIPSEYYGIPIDCFRHFSIPIHSLSGIEISKLRDIVDWAKSQNEGKVLDNISYLQRKLGAPALNEKNYEKVWQYIKMNKLTNSIAK